MILSSIKKYLGWGTSFNEDLDILKKYVKNDNHFEQSKASGANNVNKNVAALNANNESISALRIAYEKGVIGSKINIQMRTEDEVFNSSFEAQLAIWSKKGNCEITGRFYRGLAERSLVGYAKIQGGYIIRHHFNIAWKIPYKFEIIPLHMIDRTVDNLSDNIFNGIEINNFGEITGIYLYQDTSKSKSKRISYSDLSLFLISWVDATQYSGLSPISPVLSTLDMLSTYSLAELKSARQRAEGSIIIKTKLFEQILNIKRAKAKSLDRSSAADVSEKEMAELYSTFKIKGSLTGANYIPSDDDVVDLKGKENSIFADLESLGKRGISSGAGLSTQTTFREMPSSYNAALLNAQLDDEQFAIDFEDFIELTWREVIEGKLLQAMVMAKRIIAPKYWTNPEIYECVEFMRKSRSHIDPVKHQKAITEGLANGSLNQIDELAKTGVDARTHIEKEIKYIQMREQMYKEAGIPLNKNEEIK